MTLITIRIAKEHDARSLLQIHYDAVHQIAAKDYGHDITSLWAPEIDDTRLKNFLSNPDNEIRLIAEIDQQPIGFGAIVLALNELRACYISPHALRKGVGKALIKEIESIAIKNGLTYLKLDSSLTAERFYNACGYETVNYALHPLNNGKHQMRCVKMRKSFT